jgi:uncharacterized membrane protein YdjX (TVP38/TMEM64 family)
LLVLFQRRPFFAVWLCSWSPIPYWIVAALAPLSRYPMGKFLFATFLGRGPRVWFFAALGLVVPVATRTLVTYVLAAITLGVVIATYQRHRAAARPLSPLNEPRLLCGSLPS